MKLAEALIERADIQRQIEQIKSRMQENATVQEGDEPAEKISELLVMYEGMMSSLERLIIRINKTNSTTPFEDMTMADAIAKRDCLKSKIGVYKALLYNYASISSSRYSRSEIKMKRCVDVDKTQKIIDKLSKEYRELDTKMQGLNWTADLVE